MDPETLHEAPAPPRRSPFIQFLRAPIEARSYKNLLFLALAFPLGLTYFLFLTVGLSLGVGLTLIWVGIPILALVFAGSWGMTALERQLAIHLLGAAVPPMSPAPPAAPSAPRGFWRTVQDFLGNPVTWKGMGYLLIKLPLGVVTFAVTVFLLSLSAAFLIAPFAYPMGLLELDGVVFTVDSPGSALLCGVVGLLIAFLSLHALNGLAWIWRALASAMLGQRALRGARAPGPGAGRCGLTAAGRESGGAPTGAVSCATSSPVPPAAASSTCPSAPWGSASPAPAAPAWRCGGRARGTRR